MSAKRYAEEFKIEAVKYRSRGHAVAETVATIRWRRAFFQLLKRERIRHKTYLTVTMQGRISLITSRCSITRNNGTATTIGYRR
jgi:hypothetical protein